MEKRTKISELLVLLRPANSLQNGARLAENLEHSAHEEREGVFCAPQSEQLARTFKKRVFQSAVKFPT